ncbi:MAG: glycoside hydrolase family 16 protein [Bacteroidota bacterium]
MKLYLFLNPLFWFILGCGDSQETQLDAPDPWTMVFEDDFNNDLSAWNIWESGAFNEEIQLYRIEQLSLENSVLTIAVKREDDTGPTSIVDNTVKNFEYVSGRIESKTLFGPSNADGEHEYRFAARIRLPAGHGMWPAFWTYGDPWPTQGEIDILEARGGKPLEYQTNIFYGTSPNINLNQDTDILHYVEQDLTADFHVYEMIWKSTSIDIIFDGELLYTYTANGNNNISDLFGKKQKVVLNTAVGGWFFTDRNPANYVDNASMEVDWVRVYKR